MEYRRLGNAGIKVSQLSFGSWVTFKNQLALESACECMRTAYDAGINFFDNAEVYAKGQSEEIMGAALKRLGWRRSSYLVSTKIFWGLEEGPNERNTLNRKYLIEATNGALKRLELDYVDLLFCHRPDPHTPLEEVVQTMHEIVSSGKALYWGTSEWSAAEIASAWHIAQRYGWHKPQMEQPQYHVLHRHRVEIEYQRLYADCGLGLTTWSPLASGLLTGKYNNGIPQGSRATIPGYEWLQERLTREQALQNARKFCEIAKDLGHQPNHLAIAWCTSNPHVSTVILGASSKQQLEDNLKALNVLAELNDEVKGALDKLFPVHLPPGE